MMYIYIMDTKTDLLEQGLLSVRKALIDSGRTLYPQAELRHLVSNAIPENEALSTAIVSQITSQLLDDHTLTCIRLSFPIRTETRYAFGKVNLLSVLASMYPKGYFSHLTAVMLHRWRPLTWNHLYINVEQPPKPQATTEPTQSRIDSAFNRPPRVTNTFAMFEGCKIILLSGKQTNDMGVIEVQNPEQDSGDFLRLSDPERTLIDTVVRPFYVGSPQEILEIFSAAKSTVDPERIAAYLRNLDYIYPYHQVLGFYMTRAGYEVEGLKPLAELPRKFDFYIDYGLKETRFDEEWRVFHSL